jgi:DNA polymerase V
VQTNRFRDLDEQYSNGITIPLVEPSADNRVLAGAALHGLVMIYREGFKYKKAGIMLMNLQPDT